MNGLAFYKAFPRDFFEGTAGMPFEDKAAYRLVLDMVYMQGGNLPDNPQYIAGLLGCSVRKWNAIRGRLLASGKIYLTDSGAISNFRADVLLENLRSYRDKKAENARGPRKNKELEKRAFPIQKKEPESEDTSVSSVKARKRAVRLSPDWVLPDEWFQDALDIGLDPAVIRDEAENMRDWSLSAQKGAKLDWHATWRNWCRRKKRELENDKHRAGGRGDVQQQRAENRRRAISEAIRAAEKGD